jgi:hypothetical protein
VATCFSAIRTAHEDLLGAFTFGPSVVGTFGNVDFLPRRKANFRCKKCVGLRIPA